MTRPAGTGPIQFSLVVDGTKYGILLPENTTYRNDVEAARVADAIRRLAYNTLLQYGTNRLTPEAPTPTEQEHV